MADTFRKLVCTSYSRDFQAVSEIVEVPVVAPAPGQVLIRNRFGGVNASDINISGGVYFSDGHFPFDLGVESIGEVVAVGEGVEGFAVGDYAISPGLGSGYAEMIYRNATELIPSPVCTAEALSVVVAGLTASIGLHEVGEMGTAETVVVTAAAGGVGSFVVQLAKLAGNHVIGTCSTAEKGAQLEALGCDRVVLYRDEDLGDVLASEYPDGVDLVFEQVGDAVFDACVDNLARRGRVVVCGFISEYADGPFEVTAPRIYHKLLWKSAQIRAFLFTDWPDEIPVHIARLFELVEAGQLSTMVDPTEFLGVDAITDAVDHLQSGRNRGKVVVSYR